MDIRKTEAYKKWRLEVEGIKSGDVFRRHESEADKQRRIERARTDYEFFVSYYFPDVARCKCGKFQTDAAKFIRKNPNTRAVFEWARGHAKSTHMGVFVPLWLKIQKERQFHTLVLVGKSEDSADRLLADLRRNWSSTNAI